MKIYTEFNQLVENVASNYAHECFIVGTDQSINKFNLNFLNNKFTIGINDIILKNFYPDILYISELDLLNNQNFIDNLKGSEILIITSSIIKNILLDKGIKKKQIIKVINVDYKLLYSHTVFDLWNGDIESTTATGNPISDVCIPLSIYLNFLNIYIIGLDGSWDASNFFNFHYNNKSYYTIAQKEGMKNFPKTSVSMGKIALLAKLKGANIINLSPGSSIFAFERGDPNQLFPDLVKSFLLDVNDNYILFGNEIFKIVKANNNIKNACSIFSIKTKSFIKHEGNEIILKPFEENEEFKNTSSFYTENSFIDDNKVSFSSFDCHKYYLVKDIYIEGYTLFPFNIPFIAEKSSFTVYKN